MIAIMLQNLPDLFAALKSDRRAFGPGELVFRRDSAVEWLHFVEDGTVHLVRYQEGGAATVLQRAEAGNFLAEASLFSPHYHCDAAAVTSAIVVRYPKRSVIDAMRSNPDFAQGWAQYLSREVQRTRARAEMFSNRRLEDRLSSWLAARDGALPGKGQWAAVAKEIGVTPAALYRHLAGKRGGANRAD
jgi:CRP-like cAMP-binding protein